MSNSNEPSSVGITDSSQFDASTINPQANHDLKFGQFDNYELIRRIGGGGMGEVFLARHHKFRNRLYAVKVLRPDLVDEQERFENEVKILGELNHPNIVFAQDAGNSNGQPYLVMEYVSGCNLQELMLEHKNVPFADACELIRQAAVGLAYAYEQAGLIHRDIKPSNLMLTSDSKVKVLDLGLARINGLRSGELTKAGQILGTPDYMAPEQWDSASDVTVASDVYSLSCSLYALITGKPPFYSENNSSLVAKMSAHLESEIPNICSNRRDVPAELGNLLMRGMAKSPVSRIRTPGELAEALRPYTDSSDLTRYNSALKESGEQSLITTDNIELDKQITQKQFPPPNPDDKLLSARRLMVLSAIAVFCLLVLGVWWKVYWDSARATSDSSNKSLQQVPTKEQAAVSVSKFEILVNRNGLFEPIENVIPLQPNDPIRFSIEFDRPAYAKLFWADASGLLQELFPMDPENGIVAEGTVVSIESPIEIDRGWPLTPSGSSEVALLFVSDKPIIAANLPQLEPMGSGSEFLSSVVSYKASPNTKALSETGDSQNANATRSLGKTTIKVDDPVLNYLESIRKDFESVRAIRIPIKLGD